MNGDVEEITKTYKHKHNWQVVGKNYEGRGMGLRDVGEVLFVCSCGRGKIVSIKRTSKESD